jgi:hypothetical protein
VDRSWLDSVRPSDSEWVQRAASRPALIAEMSGLIGANLVGWGVERAEDLFERADDLPDPEFTSVRVSEAVVFCALIAVRTGKLDNASLNAEAAEATRTAVMRGMPIERILQALQRTFANLARELSVLTDRELPATGRGEPTRQLLADLFAGLDFLSGMLSTRFAAERERWLASAAFARREPCDALHVLRCHRAGRHAVHRV